jgi:SAM-dependent methyltransferase
MELSPTPRWLATRILFPGQDVHTWSRDRQLARWLQSGDLETLNVGFGTGALMFAAYLKGNRVLGVSHLESRVQSVSTLFDDLHVPKSRVMLKGLNIHDLHTLDRTFDQITCTDTLLQPTSGASIIQTLTDLLRPQGKLILSVPNASHPHAVSSRVQTNNDQTSGAYTLDAITALLDQSGLQVLETMGLGSSWLTMVNTPVRILRDMFGDQLATPLVLAALPLARLDRRNPAVPVTLAVCATRGHVPLRLV